MGALKYFLFQDYSCLQPLFHILHSEVRNVDYNSMGLTAKSPKVTVKLFCCLVAAKLITTSQAIATVNITKFLANG